MRDSTILATAFCAFPVIWYTAKTIHSWIDMKITLKAMRARTELANSSSRYARKQLEDVVDQIRKEGE